MYYVYYAYQFTRFRTVLRAIREADDCISGTYACQIQIRMPDTHTHSHGSSGIATVAAFLFPGANENSTDALRVPPYTHGRGLYTWVAHAYRDEAKMMI